ncbi:MAG TPA: phage holin family protein [Candidatus Angelobacter sp.]|nr:phage holin family protein [Candidatus Angelobacter sp.]
MHKEKSIGAVLSETKEELKEIFQTRVQILKTEFQEKVHTWKRCVPSLAAAAILIVTSWFTLTFTLVALVQAWFASGPYTWFLGGLIVTLVFLLAGGVLGWMAYKQIRSAGIAPQRTLSVLREDQMWVQKEARRA